MNDAGCVRVWLMNLVLRCKKIKGAERAYRIRWVATVVYEVDDSDNLVLILQWRARCEKTYDKRAEGSLGRSNAAAVTVPEDEALYPRSRCSCSQYAVLPMEHFMPMSPPTAPPATRSAADASS